MQGIQFQAIGRLAADPEVRYFDSGKAKTTFDIAVSRPYGRDETDFVRCEAWGKTGELIGNYLRKGSQCAISGHLEIQKWTQPDGQKRSAPALIVESVQFLGKKADAPSPAQSQPQQYQQQPPYQQPYQPQSQPQQYQQQPSYQQQPGQPPVPPPPSPIDSPF